MTNTFIKYNPKEDNYILTYTSEYPDINIEINNALELVIELYDAEGDGNNKIGIPLDTDFVNRIKEVHVDSELMKTEKYLHKVVFYMKNIDIAIHYN